MKSERIAWVAVAAWIAVIYATVPVARLLQRLVSDIFGGRGVFLAIALAGIAVSALAAIVVTIRRSTSLTWARATWLAIVSACMMHCAWRLRAAPEEALHFLEYGFLGLLFTRAFAFRHPAPFVYIAAAIAGTLVGVVDEMIQWSVPGRYWDWRDVGINALAVLLMQLAAAFGLPRPARPPDAASGRSMIAVCRLAAALSAVVGLCLLNTPSRVDRYLAHLPGLGFLAGNPSDMSEYGFLHRDPAIGAFKSRLSAAELQHQDAQRGVAAAQYLNQYRKPGGYSRFLQAHAGYADPLVYEARVRLFSMWHHLGILWPGSWQAPMQINMPPDELERHCTIGYREHQILEQYFPVTFTNSLYMPLPTQVAAVKAAQRPGRDYLSPVSKHLITWAPEPWSAVALFTLAGLFLTVGGRKNR